MFFTVVSQLQLSLTNSELVPNDWKSMNCCFSNIEALYGISRYKKLTGYRIFEEKINSICDTKVGKLLFAIGIQMLTG